MTLRFRPLIALAFVCIAALPSNPASAQGTIQGRVTDATGGRIPGVEIRVSGRGYQRMGVTDGQGVYRLSNLPAGMYSVTTKMNGFRAARCDRVIVATGRTVQVNISLTVDGPVHVVEVSAPQPVYFVADVMWATMARPPLADVYPRFDAIVHLRIARTLPAKPQPQPDGGRLLCTEHEVDIIEVLKAHPEQGPTGAQLAVLQESAGTWETLKGLAPYPEGTELVAFLTWRPAAQRFALGRNVFAVRERRVVLLRGEWVIEEDTSGEPLFKDVPAGIAIEEFLTRLRALGAPKH